MITISYFKNFVFKKVAIATFFIYLLFISSNSYSQSIFSTELNVGESIKNNKVYPSLEGTHWHIAQHFYYSKIKQLQFGVVLQGIKHDNYKAMSWSLGLSPICRITLKEKAKNKITMHMSTGIAYHNSFYNEVNNNYAIGSRFTNISKVALAWQSKNFPYISIWVLHFSNANTRFPNAGLNTVGIGLGKNYGNDIPKQHESWNTKIPKKNTNHILTASIGIKSGTAFRGPIYSIYTFHYAIAKRYQWHSYKSWIQFHFDQSVWSRDYQDERNDTQLWLNSLRCAWGLGHELYFNHWTLYTDGGLYLYYASKPKAKLISKLGFAYSLPFCKNIELFNGVLAHKGTANYYEFGIRIKF